MLGCVRPNPLSRPGRALSIRMGAFQRRATAAASASASAKGGRLVAIWARLVLSSAQRPRAGSAVLRKRGASLVARQFGKLGSANE